MTNSDLPLSDLLDGLPAPDHGPDFWTDLETRLAGEPAPVDRHVTTGGGTELGDLPTIGTPAPSRSFVRRWGVALAAAAAIVVAIAVGLDLLAEDNAPVITDTPPTTSAPPTTTPPPDSSTVDDATPDQTEVDTIDISDAVSELSIGVRTSDQIAAGAGSVWVSTGGGLLRIDPVTGAVVADIQVDSINGSRPAVSDDAVWIVGAESLYRIDPATNSIVAEIAGLALTEAAVAVTDDSVWVSGKSAGTPVVRRIDPATNAITATIWIETPSPQPFPFGTGARWAITIGPDGNVYFNGEGTIYRIDPSTNTVTSSAKIGNQPGLRIAVDDDSTWVSDSSVFRVDAALESPAETVFAPVSGRLGGVSIVDGQVVVGSSEGILYLLDQTSGAPSDAFELGIGPGGPPSFAVSEGFLWISNGRLWRLPLSELDIPPGP